MSSSELCCLAFALPATSPKTGSGGANLAQALDTRGLKNTDSSIYSSAIQTPISN